MPTHPAARWLRGWLVLPALVLPALVGRLGGMYPTGLLLCVDGVRHRMLTREEFVAWERIRAIEPIFWNSKGIRWEIDIRTDEPPRSFWKQFLGRQRGRIGVHLLTADPVAAEPNPRALGVVVAPVGGRGRGRRRRLVVRRAAARGPAVPERIATLALPLPIALAAAAVLVLVPPAARSGWLASSALAVLALGLLGPLAYLLNYWTRPGSARPPPARSAGWRSVPR